MTAGPWTLPQRLVRLIESGWWPGDFMAAMKQNPESLVPEDRVRVFASEESVIHFYPPPFHTVSELVASGDSFWTSEMACPEGLSFDHAVLIGDFGPGSDAPILLDYRAVRPSVIRICWGKTWAENRWIMAAPSFDEMCEILGIGEG